MKILLTHCDYIEYEKKKKAIESAEQTDTDKERIEECLVVFCSAEQGDDESVAEKTVAEIKKVAEQVHTKTIVVYPFVHLKRSLMIININKATKKAKPTLCAICSALGLTFLPKNFSKIKNINLPPSSAGIGKILRTARFSERSPTSCITESQPKETACEVMAAIPTGPATPSGKGVISRGLIE